MLLSWNIKGSQSDEKLKNLRITADAHAISIILIQESKTLVPFKSLESYFPESSWLKLFTPGSRNNEYYGGIISLVRRNHLKVDVVISDISTNLTSAHLLHFNNDFKIINCYQPYRIQSFDSSILYDYDPNLLIGDINYYRSNPSGSRSHRDVFFHNLEESDNYKFINNLYTFGYEYDERNTKMGPDHCIVKVPNNDGGDDYESPMAVTILHELQGYSDHAAIKISGDFENILKVPACNPTQCSYYFDYADLNKEMMENYYNSLEFKGEDFTLEDYFDDLNGWLVNCRRRLNDKAGKFLSLDWNEDFLLKFSGVTDISVRRDDIKEFVVGRDGAIDYVSFEAGQEQGFILLNLQHGKKAEEIIATLDENKAANIKGIDIKFEIGSELEWNWLKAKGFRPGAFMSYEKFQNKLADYVSDLSASNLSGGFESMKEFDILNNNLENLSTIGKVQSCITKKAKVSQFEEFKERVEEPFMEKRSVRVKHQGSKKFASYLKEKSFELITISELISAAVTTNKTSVGYDRIHFSMLPSKRKHWLILLKLINEHILSEQSLHSNFRTSRLIFIDRSDGALRPISIGSRITTITENALLIRLQKLVANSSIYDSSFGFLKTRSVEQLISGMVGKIYLNNSRNLKSSILQCDISKAYDRLSHKSIINSLADLVKSSGNLKHYGILLWFSIKWLKNRSSRYENLVAHFNRGVPQGSPLSCLLFVVAFSVQSKSFSRSTNVEVFDMKFADDYHIILSAKKKSDILRAKDEILSGLKSWLGDIGLTLNENKTHVLHVFQRNSDMKALRVLGVYVDQNLNFNYNLEKLKQWCRYRILFFRRMRKILGENYNLALWRKFLFTFRMKICYGLWHLSSIGASTFKEYERLWTQCIKGVLGFAKFMPSETVYRESKFCKLEDFLQYLLTYRLILSPKKFESLFSLVYKEEWGVGANGVRGLRIRSRMVDVFARGSVVHSAVRIWKEKIDKIRKSFTPQSKNLKMDLKKQLLKQEFLVFDLTKSKITKLNNYYYDKITGK